MKQIVIHIGDRVHHKTLGDGVVIAVNEDLCTVRFSEKEAYFRVPEAFVRGYLTSANARLGSDKTYKQITEITAPPQKNKLGWIGWLLAIGVPAPYTLPFVIVFLIIYLGTDSTLFLILTILGILLYIGLVAKCVIKLKEPIDPSKPYSGSAGPSSDADSITSSEAAGLMFGAGLLGGLLGHYIGKHHKSHAEKVRDDWLWQEKYRRYDDYYDGENW